jgi:dTDP-4-amino-4,6-dideoxygalactose transaminase
MTVASGKPALLGGAPLFEAPIALTRPTLDVDAGLLADLSAVLTSGLLTNGSNVAAFERAAAEVVGIEHAVATSSCTAGLMLVFRCLSLTGDVVVPSFTFMASAHAVAWNGLTPVFADSDPQTWNLDPGSARAAGAPRTAALSATHVFGAPADVDGLERVAGRGAVPLVLDAAHAFGATYPDGSRVGSRGVAEVFSLSPTKPLSTGEGGLVTTADAALAAQLRIARDYGNPGNYDAMLVGLNARMTEVAGLLGRRGLERFPAWLERRRALAERYAARLRGLPGLSFQAIADGATSARKDFTVLVHAGEFGLTRDVLAAALARENIPTRSYFDPPLHRQAAYRARAAASLPVADALAREALTLPLYSHMPEIEVDGVCEALVRAHEHSAAIAARMRRFDPAAVSA